MTLIKCKKCSHDISDQAVQCPHCGIQIKPINSCYECGKNIPKDTLVCSFCGAPQGLYDLEYEDASILLTLLFGPFYLLYKGWVSIALIYTGIGVITSGIGFFIMPFYIKDLIKYIHSSK